MADKKPQGFLSYVENEKQVLKLTDEERGKLYKAMYRYFTEGVEPEDLTDRRDMLFSILAERMDRDIAKYQEKCEKNRRNVKTRYTTKDNGIGPSTTVDERIQTLPTQTQTETQTQTQTQINLKEAMPDSTEVMAYCDKTEHYIDVWKFLDYYIGKGGIKGDWMEAVDKWWSNGIKMGINITKAGMLAKDFMRGYGQ